MSTTTAYNALMTHDLILTKQVKDMTGSLSDGKSYEEKGFVEYTSRRAVNNEGEDVELMATIYLKKETNFNETHPTWRIKHNGQLFKAEVVERIDDPRTGETHHYEIGVL